MTLTPDETAAKAAGYTMPEGGNLISGGDDAIRANAVKVHEALLDVNDRLIEHRLTGGEHFDDLRESKDYRVSSSAIGQQIGGWPEDANMTTAWLKVRIGNASTGLGFQLLQVFGSGGGVWWRSTGSIAGDRPFPWADWRRLDGSADMSDLGSGITNALLIQDFTRRHGGAWSTDGRAAVSLRLDHGLANARDKLMPMLRSAGIIPSIALNSRNWDRPENGGVTAQQVDDWVSAGEVEIWNHGATHSNPTTEEGVRDEVVTGLAELREQLPSAQIDGWAIPGVGTDPYLGMGTLTSVQQLYESFAGRLILEHHAVTTGHIAGTHQRVLDGTVRQAQRHYGLDSRSPADAITEIDHAIANGTGLQLMLHPSLVDQTGRITTAQMQQVVNYIVQKRNAGEIVVCSPYQMMLADATRPAPAVADVTGLAARLAALEYDSGERNITSLIPAEVLSGALHTWRTGSTVWLDFRDLEVADPSTTYHSWSGMLPPGLRPSRSYVYMPLAPAVSTSTGGPVRLDRNGGVVVYNAKPNRRMTGLISFPALDAPPSSPPGSNP